MIDVSDLCFAFCERYGCPAAFLMDKEGFVSVFFHLVHAARIKAEVAEFLDVDGVHGYAPLIVIGWVMVGNLRGLYSRQVKDVSACSLSHLLVRHGLLSFCCSSKT